MLRKLLLSWVVAAGSMLWLSATPLPAAAGEPVTRQFQVLVQDEAGWHPRGTYPLQSEARQAAVSLWKEGKRVLIREVVTASQK